MSFFSSIGNIATNALKTFETVVQHPIESAKTIGNQTAFNALSEKTNAAPLTTQIKNILVSTGTVAAAVALPGTATGRSIVAAAGSSIAKVIAANPIKTIVATAAAIPIVSAVVQSPKLQSGLANAPSNLANFGGNIGKAIENPSIASVTNIVKENPILSTITVGGAALAAGTAANTVATYLNTRATKTNTESTLDSGSNVLTEGSTISGTPSQIIIQNLTPTTNPTPTNAPRATTAPIKAKKKAKKKTKKKAKKKTKKKTLKRRKSKK